MAERKKSSTSGGSKKTSSLETSGSVKEGTEKTGGAKTSSRSGDFNASPNPADSIPVRSWQEERSLSDIEKAMRDNPGLRTPDASRRNLPPEEFPDGSEVRKDEARARKAVEKAIDALEKAQEDVSGNSTVAGKVRTALRTLRS